MPRENTQSRRTGRIYYGPPGAEKSMWWKVKRRNAKKPVTINGTVAAALAAYPGVTVGCAISKAAENNADQFPHPAYLASVTGSTIEVVDSLNKDGSPRSVVCYEHSYSKLVDMNDTEELKNDPALMERQLRLRPPRKQTRRGVKALEGKNTSASTSTRESAASVVRHRGALSRAVKAGRIGKHVADQLTHAVAHATAQAKKTAKQQGKLAL